MEEKRELKIDEEFERLFPRMTKEEFAELKEDIMNYKGLREAIEITPDDYIIDGYNRYHALKELKKLEWIRTKEKDFAGNRGAIIDYIHAKNGKRRQLNDFQKAEEALRYEELRKKYPPFGGKATVEEMAKEKGVSKRTFERAKAIIEKAPEGLKKKVRTGKISIHRGWQIVERKTGTKKAKKERMYKDTETWNPFQGCEFDCSYCVNGYRESLVRLKTKFPCCFKYKPHKHEERLTRIPNARVIFVLGDSDPYWAIKQEPKFFEKILEAMRNDKKEDRLWFLQSKAPACFKDYLDSLPENAYLLTTLETNRDKDYDKISKAPEPSKRYKDFLSLKWEKKIVTVEPILDFDLDIFSKMLTSMTNLKAVFIGYESHGLVKLETPSFHKILDLMCLLRKATIKVCPKHIPKVAYREFKA